MNKGFLSGGFVLKPFRPNIVVHQELNTLDMYTKDVSLITRWLGLIHIEHLLEKTESTNILRGFHILGVKELNGKEPTSLAPLLLLRAFRFDLKSKQHQHSWYTLCRLYAGPAWLLLRYPGTWWLTEK